MLLRRVECFPQFVLALPLAAAMACGGAPIAPAPAPAPVPRATAPVSVSDTRAMPARPLPPVPEVDGPLAIKVVYPEANQQITSRDSNFIFGTIGSGKATLAINGAPARVYPNGAFMAWIANPPAGLPRYDLVAASGTDTVRSTQPVRLLGSSASRRPTAPVPPEGQKPARHDSANALTARLDSMRALLMRDEPIGVVQLGSPSAMGDTDATVIGRPTPGGTYKWFFTPGTQVPLMERVDGYARIRLDKGLDIYVADGEARDVPPAAPANGNDAPVPRLTVPVRQMSNMRVRASTLGADVVIPIGRPAPYFVEETSHSIVLTLYGVRGNTDIINYASADTMVSTVEWAQETNDRARVTVNLRAAPYGYLVLFERNALVLKLRGRPAIDPARPLAGLTIAVDPGHPPIGSTGPTGLYEPQATLPVGFKLKALLEERGATVIMTRTTDAPVALGDRPIMARRANVNAFVSVHYNALPDGINPFLHPGTGTYFFRTQSEPLARTVQRGLVAQLGLQDLGINYDNLAVVRGTWYPAVLCEGAFIMMPDQEAAMRTPEFQERYARGIADGLENYFRELNTR